MTPRMVPSRIILHCSATEDGRVVDWQTIRRYHVQHRGWHDIGYHFGIERIGDDYEVLVGRMPTRQGAHTSGANHDSIGICFVGGFDETPPPAEQWRRGVELVAWLCAAYKINPGRIYGHREFVAGKTCPGLAFDTERFRDEARAAAKG